VETTAAPNYGDCLGDYGEGVTLRLDDHDEDAPKLVPHTVRCWHDCPCCLTRLFRPWMECPRMLPVLMQTVLSHSGVRRCFLSVFVATQTVLLKLHCCCLLFTLPDIKQLEKSQTVGCADVAFSCFASLCFVLCVDFLYFERLV
jgi:hypothetical protein